MCILNLHELWYQCCLCAFLRPNLSRWMRRTRPIPWCLWLPCPRSPSTSRPSTASLHQKMGPTPPPPLTDTLPPRPQWPTRRCESWHPWPPVLPITHWDTLHTSPSAASETVHTLRQIQHESTKYVHLPSSFPQPAPLGTMMTTTMELMTMMTIMTMPVMWKVWDHWPLLVSRGAYIRCVWDWDCSAGHWLGFVSCPDFSLVVTIIGESPNNAKCVLIPDEE